MAPATINNWLFTTKPAAAAALNTNTSRVSADPATCLAVAVGAEYPVAFVSPST